MAVHGLCWQQLFASMVYDSTGRTNDIISLDFRASNSFLFVVIGQEIISMTVRLIKVWKVSVFESLDCCFILNLVSNAPITPM